MFTDKEKKLLSAYLNEQQASNFSLRCKGFARDIHSDGSQKATMCSDSPLQGKKLRTMDPIKYFGKNYKHLGAGAFGEVWKTTKNFTIKYAVKDFTSIKEIALMDYLNHPNLLCISGIFGSELARYGYVSPYANYGTLESITTTLKKYPNMRIEAYYQIFIGLAYLHAGFIIHADIKPANILVFRQGWYTYNYKIADFGLAIPCSYVNVPRYPNVVTAYWRAPELFEKTTRATSGGSMEPSNFTNSIDIWAMGVIIYDLIYINQQDQSIFGKIPEETPEEMFGETLYTNILTTDFKTKFMPGSPEFENAILNNQSYMNNNNILRTDFKTKFLPGEQELANNCLTIDSIKRPSAIECINSAIFKSILKVSDIKTILFNTLSMPETDTLEIYENRTDLVKYVFNIIKKIYKKQYHVPVGEKKIFKNSPEYRVMINVFFYAVSILDFYFSGEKVLDFKNLKKRFAMYTSEKKYLQKKNAAHGISERRKKDKLLNKFYKNIIETNEHTFISAAINEIKKYSDLKMIIDIAIKIAFSFIDDITFTKEKMDINVFGFFDDTFLERIDNQLFFPTAIQLYNHMYAKEPDIEELDRLAELLMSSPYQETFLI